MRRLPSRAACALALLAALGALPGCSGSTGVASAGAPVGSSSGAPGGASGGAPGSDAGLLARLGQGLGRAAPTPSARVQAAAAAGAPSIVVLVEGRDAADGFLLVASRAGVASWESPAGLGLATRDGALLSTRGFGGDLASADPSGPMALVRAGQAGLAQRFMGFYDGEGRVEVRAYACDVAPEGPREVDLGDGVPRRASLVSETCRNPTQSFRNLYWLDGAGTLLQSRQWAGELTGPLAIYARPAP